MRIKEVTNPEEQLGLLKIIIDNTWSAIKQQADDHAKQQSSLANKLKPKAKISKVKPAAPQPKPLPNKTQIQTGQDKSQVKDLKALPTNGTQTKPRVQAASNSTNTEIPQTDQIQGFR
jgi:hypothetical protein